MNFFRTIYYLEAFQETFLGSLQSKQKLKLFSQFLSSLQLKLSEMSDEQLSQYHLMFLEDQCKKFNFWAFPKTWDETIRYCFGFGNSGFFNTLENSIDYLTELPLCILEKVFFNLAQKSLKKSENTPNPLLSILFKSGWVAASIIGYVSKGFKWFVKSVLSPFKSIYNIYHSDSNKFIKCLKIGAIIAVALISWIVLPTLALAGGTAAIPALKAIYTPLYAFNTALTSITHWIFPFTTKILTTAPFIAKAALDGLGLVSAVLLLGAHLVIRETLIAATKSVIKLGSRLCAYIKRKTIENKSSPQSLRRASVPSIFPSRKSPRRASVSSIFPTQKESSPQSPTTQLSSRNSNDKSCGWLCLGCFFPNKSRSTDRNSLTTPLLSDPECAPAPHPR